MPSTYSTGLTLLLKSVFTGKKTILIKITNNSRIYSTTSVNQYFRLSTNKTVIFNLRLNVKEIKKIFS